MRTLRITLAYDGTNYVGWQVQPNGVSVQEVVEAALERLTGERIRVVAAGRTDSGVHALGQVISFTTRAMVPTDRFRAALQTFLPRDVIVREVHEAPAGFSARYAAVRKRYRYVIHDGDAMPPFLRNYAYHHRGPLDVAAMHAAAREFIGTHDFRCFESQFPNKATSVRTVTEAAVVRALGWPIWDGSATTQPTAGPGEFITFEVVADGFLYNMVRAMLGTLLEVGRGRWTDDDVRRIVQEQNRGQAGATAPPHGLYLVEVEYGEAGVRS